MPEQRITTVQWAVGIFCAFIGALMLVAPDQFSGPAFAPLHGVLAWLGATLLFAGAAIIGCVILGMPRRYVVAAHFLAGAVLLVFGPTFAARGAWNALAQFSILGAGTALSAFAPRSCSEERRQTPDPFAGIIGLVATVNGSLILLSPKLFSAPIYDAIRPQLPLVGLAFFFAGLAVIVAQLFPALPSQFFRLAHLSILVPSLSFALVNPIPNRIWTSIFFHVGFSSLVASLPWTGPAIRRVDPHAFSVRLASAIALAAALPLIVIAGVVTGDQERQARTAAETSLQTSAVGVASDISHYIGLHQAAVVGFAALPGLVDKTPEAQRASLKAFISAYPDALGISTVDPTGTVIATSTDLPVPKSVAGEPSFQRLKQANRTQLQAQISPVTHRPVLGIATPVFGSGGGARGYVSAAIDLRTVSEAVARAASSQGTVAYLVDATGHTIAHPDQSLVASFADLSATPQVAAALASEPDHGVVSSSGPSGDLLSAFARAPDLEWTVVVEQPAATALASVRSSRNVAFGLLVGAILLAVVAGTLMSRPLAGPLVALSLASRQLALGDSGASLPRSGTSEMRELVNSFGEMRERLAAQGAEREQLLAEVQGRAAELAISNRELEAFTYSVAHDLRSPVRHMDGFSKALAEDYAGVLDEQGRQYLQYVRDGSVKLGQIIDDLLALTGVRRREMRRAEVDLSQMAQEIATQLQGEQPERQVEFAIAPGVVANGDQGMLRIVLQNLLGNAWKFTSKRPTARIEFGVEQQDNKTAYYVKDNGAGFNMAYAERLFRAFGRLHNEHEYPGTGVGLAIVERIIRRHGGTVWAEGAVGEGATFHFALG